MAPIAQCPRVILVNAAPCRRRCRHHRQLRQPALIVRSWHFAVCARSHKLAPMLSLVRHPYHHHIPRRLMSSKKLSLLCVLLSEFECVCVCARVLVFVGMGV